MPEKEVIVIDDGSSDESCRVIRGCFPGGELYAYPRSRHPRRGCAFDGERIPADGETAQRAAKLLLRPREGKKRPAGHVPRDPRETVEIENSAHFPRYVEANSIFPERYHFPEELSPRERLLPNNPGRRFRSRSAKGREERTG